MMTYEDVKKMITIPDFLKCIGAESVDRKGDFLHYHSPLREDKNPSFWVNTKTQTCGDFGGNDKIGSVIDLAAAYWHTNTETAKKNLEDMLCLGSFSFAKQRVYQTANTPPNTNKTANTTAKYEIKPLQKINLLAYAYKRGITAPTAQKYLKECWKDDKYFYLAFQNDNGGYALRNSTDSNFSKINYGKGGVTTISHNSDRVVFFEGFFDFLSWVEYMAAKGKHIEQYNIIVLNSCSNISSILNKLDYYKAIYTFLDNDPKGRETTEKITSKYPDKLMDLTPKIIKSDCKDFNDYWVQLRKNAQITTIIR